MIVEVPAATDRRAVNDRRGQPTLWNLRCLGVGGRRRVPGRRPGDGVCCYLDFPLSAAVLSSPGHVCAEHGRRTFHPRAVAPWCDGSQLTDGCAHGEERRDVHLDQTGSHRRLGGGFGGPRTFLAAASRSGGQPAGRGFLSLRVADEPRQGAVRREWQALFKDCNAVLAHLGRSLRASREALVRGVAPLDKGLPLPDCLPVSGKGSRRNAWLQSALPVRRPPPSSRHSGSCR